MPVLSKISKAAIVASIPALLEVMDVTGEALGAMPVNGTVLAQVQMEDQTFMGPTALLGMQKQLQNLQYMMGLVAYQTDPEQIQCDKLKKPSFTFLHRNIADWCMKKNKHCKEDPTNKKKCVSTNAHKILEQVGDELKSKVEHRVEHQKEHQVEHSYNNPEEEFMNPPIMKNQLQDEDAAHK